ncbi:hypothetical protein F4801DRAFT_537421 [Xylaria longipes]|nr:hypothetical protein F4801DRAFT_537421 [Xylaria longipes]
MLCMRLAPSSCIISDAAVRESNAASMMSDVATADPKDGLQELENRLGRAVFPLCVGTNDILQTYPYGSSAAACSAGVSPRVHGFFCRNPPHYPSRILVIQYVVVTLSLHHSFRTKKGGLWRLQVTPMRYLRPMTHVRILFVPLCVSTDLLSLVEVNAQHLGEQGEAETFTWPAGFLCATCRFFFPHFKRSSWVSSQFTVKICQVSQQS